MGHGESLVPKGPDGERRPADAIGCAVLVGRIATDEISEVISAPSGRTRSGQAGAAARARSLNAEERSEIARKAASARWG